MRGRRILGHIQCYIGIQACFFLGQEPYRAGLPKLAVNLWITALEAFVTQVDVLFHAEIAGFALRVIDTGSHAGSFSVVVPDGRFW